MSRCVWPAWILATALLGACGGDGAGGRDLDHELLLRERVALRRALESGPSGGPADALVAVPAPLVRQLLAYDLPFEATVDRFRITVDGADVDFRGSALALVTLAGRVTWIEREDVQADIEIVGALEVIGVESATGSLRAGVEILGVRTRDVRVGALSPPAERLLDALAERPLAELQAVVREVEIPVRLLRTVQLPAVAEDEVTIAAAELPLSVAVRRVRVGDDVLLVELDVDVPVPAVVTDDAAAGAEVAGDGS